MSKKILSLVLAVAMLVSVFAFTAFAASGPLASVGLKVETDAVVGMAAGEEVNVRVYYTVPDGADLSDYLHNLSNIVLCYTDGFALNSTAAGTAKAYDARTWGASYEEYFMEDGTVNNLATFFTNVSKTFTTNDKAKGWDGAVLVQQTINTDNGYNKTSGYPIDLDCEVFTLSFVTTREITADDSIGVPENSVTTGQTKMYYINTDGTNKQYAKSLATITLDEAVAYPGAPALEKVTGKIRVNGSAVDLGYIGKSDMAVTVKAVYAGDGKTICGYTVDSAACGIAGVGIEAKVDGVTQSSTASKIYLNGSITAGAASETVQGGFQFLPALTSVGANALTSTIEIRTYVLKTDGSYVYSEWVELDAKTTYDNAVAAGMADIFA